MGRRRLTVPPAGGTIPFFVSVRGSDAEEITDCWKSLADDRASVAVPLAPPGVTDPPPYAADDIGMTPDGCVASEVDDETICSWTGEHSEGQVVVRMHVTDDGTDGYRVTTIDITC